MMAIATTSMVESRFCHAPLFGGVERRRLIWVTGFKAVRRDAEAAVIMAILPAAPLLFPLASFA
jgi:hypothetical protein